MGFSMNEYTCGVCENIFLVLSDYQGIIICPKCGSWSYDMGRTWIYALINFEKIKELKVKEV